MSKNKFTALVMSITTGLAADAAAQSVTSLSLLNADTGRAIPGYETLRSGVVLNLATLPTRRLTIKANVSGGVASVRFGYDRNPNFQMENYAPFAIRGDSPVRYSPWTPTVGSHTVTVTPFSRRGGLGETGSAVTLRFSATNVAAAPPPPAPTPRPAVTPAPAPTPARETAVIPSIPSLADWESKMLTYGRSVCSYMKDPNVSGDSKLAASYYDGAHVFYQIADYTKDYAFWNGCAAAAASAYRDHYVVPAGGAVPGYWNFSHGLAQDFLRTGSGASRSALVSLASRAAFAADVTSLQETVTFETSRETAYAIHAYLNAEAAGEPRRARLATLAGHALGHLDQWFGARTAPYVRSFMAGLTMHALIAYYEATGDRRVIPAVTNAADRLWEMNWVPAARAFRYQSVATPDAVTDPTADLNMLIAPAYAWLWHQTGESRFRERGDEIFAGGVAGAWLGGGKQFNQNYRWSPEYVRLRRLPPLR